MLILLHTIMCNLENEKRKFFLLRGILVIRIIILRYVLHLSLYKQLIMSLNILNPITAITELQ